MKELYVHVPEPCHEDWSQMSPVEQGRHCQSCQKTVVDFTRMSKAGIVDYVKSSEGSLCGRFSNDQLNVNLMPARKNKWYAKYAALLLGLVPFTGNSQSVDPVKTTIVKGKRMMSNHTNKIPTSIIINGTLLDAETKEKILFGTVALYDNDNTLVTGVETGIEGEFTLEVSEGQIIELSYIGYEPRRINYDEIKSMEGDFQFYINEGVLLGAMVTVGDIMIEEVEEVKKVDLDPVEIVAYKLPVIKGGMNTSYTVTGAMGTVFSEEKESWLKRMWKKFAALVDTSYDSALKHKRAQKLKSNDNENIEDLPRELTSVAIGIKAVEAPFLILAPNPTPGQFKINMPNGITSGTIQVVNSGNEMVFSQHLNSSFLDVDLSMFPAGSYIVSLIKDQQLIVSEILVKI